MKRLSNVMGKLVVLLSLLMLSATSAFAASAGTDWENSVITVEGMGIPSANAYNAVQARLMARRAAIVDAYRQLAEAVKGVNVDSETTVENMMVVSDRTTTHVNALIQGARIVEEYTIPEGGYAVKMQVSMFGVSNSLADAVFERPAAIEAFPAPVPSVEPSIPTVSVTVDVTPGVPSLPKAPATTSIPTTSSKKALGNVTGLIVDCRGMGLNPVMSPVIKNANGAPIYGHKNLDPDYIIANGMVSYTADIGNVARAGSNPLMVKAVSLDNHGSNPVLSLADSNLVLRENEITGFLDKTNVVFIR